jgi:hypothetical protein
LKFSSDGHKRRSVTIHSKTKRKERNPVMNANHLKTYLRDHLAGSVAALQLLDHLIKTNTGMPLERFFIALRQEVGEDQNALKKMLHDLGDTEGLMRNIGAFLSEKLMRVKLLLEDPTGSRLAHLEKLEALALGIEGKRALWRSLGSVAQEVPPLRSVDFDRLDERAEAQAKRVETLRIEAAREAFAFEDER